MFGEGIAVSDISATRSGSSLILNITNPNDPQANDQIIIQYWNTASYQIEAFEFADGTVLTNADINNLSMTGTEGADSIDLWSTVTVANGLGGDDIITSNNYTDDTIDGGSGNDTITDNGGNDQIDGGAGDDRITLNGSGTNIVDGGAGSDAINLHYQSSNTVDGGAGDDVITVMSSSYSNYNYSNDYTGGQGNDTINSGYSTDTYHFNRGDGQDTITDRGYTSSGQGDDRIVFGSGITKDHLRLSHDPSSHILIELLDDNGELTGDQIRLNNAFGNASYYMESFEFADGSSMTQAEILTAAQAVYGTADADTIYGTSLTDRIYGFAGDDTINAGSGNDVLVGRTGNDMLSGNAGNDTYLFGAGDGADTIYNYDTNAASVDTAQFEDVSIEDLWFSRSGNNLQITIAGTDDRVTISNWYSSTNYQLDQIEVGTSTLLNNQIDQLVSAMAAFDVPSGAGNVIPQDIIDQLHPVIAESWQTV